MCPKVSMRWAAGHLPKADRRNNTDPAKWCHKLAAHSEGIVAPQTWMQLAIQGAKKLLTASAATATQSGQTGTPGLTLCTHAAVCSLRMSKVYRQQSSLARVRLKASIGFQATALLLVCGKQQANHTASEETLHFICRHMPGLLIRQAATELSGLLDRAQCRHELMAQGSIQQSRCCSLLSCGRCL